jgi:Carbohydrate esterase, sialic acid-specific acetylesterase
MKQIAQDRHSKFPPYYSISGDPMKMFFSRFLMALIAAFAVVVSPVVAQDNAPAIPRPDGKPADMSKPVQVFILLGQSNMVGAGKVKGGDGSLEFAVKEKKKYPYLVDDAGAWTVRKDVRFVRYMSGKGPLNNDWMTVSGNTLGPEFGLGHPLGNAIDAPVMVLKCCIGNRALGWDLLPPGSEGFEFTDSKGVTWVHAGYKGSPDRWKKGEEAKPITWYAGKQYDDDTNDAKKALADLAKHYPEATKFEVAGFFFWQGERDAGSEALSSRYEQNLVHFIKQLRKDFNSPNAKFVLGTLGEATKGMSGNTGKVLEAHLAVDGTTGKYPEFKGNVATIYTNPMAQGGSGNGHYGGKAEVYMDVGEAMGRAMVEMLKGTK